MNLPAVYKSSELKWHIYTDLLTMGSGLKFLKPDNTFVLEFY